MLFSTRRKYAVLSRTPGPLDILAIRRAPRVQRHPWEGEMRLKLLQVDDVIPHVRDNAFCGAVYITLDTRMIKEVFEQ
jgi:hypothetical protein